MKNRVVAVLPALVDQARLRASRVVEEAVQAAVQTALDPGSGLKQVRPDLIHQRRIPGALLIGSGEHYKERRTVDSAVVLLEGHLLQYGHLAAAHLVHDLARLGVAKGRFLVRLGARQKAQYAGGQAG